MKDIEPEAPKVARLLTEAEVADLLRVKPRTVRALRHSGQLAYIAGHPVRIDERDVEDYIASKRVAARARHGGSGVRSGHRSVGTLRAAEEAAAAEKVEAMNDLIMKNAKRRFLKSRGL